MNNLSPRTKYIYTRQCLHQINNLITGHPQAQQLRRRDEFEKWRNARRRHWVETYKVRKGCYICGYKAHPDGLFFRSLGKDKRNFSVILKLSKPKTSVDYLRQRQLVCYNCHAIWQAGIRKRKEGGD